MSTNNTALVIDSRPLSLDDVHRVAKLGIPVQTDPAVAAKVQANRSVVDKQLKGDHAIYGVNTGFGSLSRHRIDAAGIRDVQRNLIRSHAAGVGPQLEDSKVRAMMLIIAASLISS